LRLQDRTTVRAKTLTGGNGDAAIWAGAPGHLCHSFTPLYQAAS
jgi:hypothetical protein